MKDWEAIHNKHLGEICTIIGNGPSLNSVPLSFLNKYDTFGTNRGYLKYVPDYYVAVNPLVITQYREEIVALNTMKFIRWGFMKEIPDAYPLKSMPLGFSLNPKAGIYEGYTVTYVCMQLAYYIGYRKVLLVGVDHRYVFEGKPNEERLLEGPDPNHFDPNYYRDAIWNNPDLKRSEASYKMAKFAFEDQIINLGPDSALDVFQRGALDDYK